jgi:lipopolysaccharide/colanic/teichoic acid biosynthesis glycosyltransferase
VAFAGSFEEKIPYYAYRHLVKPGITGWAQVIHGYAYNFENTYEKLEYDLYYIKYLSFWFDVQILLKTLKTIFTGFGSR